MTKFLIATRKSNMALAQTELVSQLLKQVDPLLDIELAENNPRGDRDQISRLDRHGGKGGAFVAEIRADVVSGRSQCAMHSLKDMPGNEETPGLVIGAYLKRSDPGDALVIKPGLSLEELRQGGGDGFKLGTNSIRRAALIKSIFPKIEVIHFRGAADSRINKLDNGIPQQLVDGSLVGPADAILLAVAGLERIGMADRISHRFAVTEMLPAVGQGIVAVECAADDWKTRALLAQIDDANARACAEAEREILWVLDGHCNSPIAAYSQIENGKMTISASVMSFDGETVIGHQGEGEACFPRELGRNVGLALLDAGAKSIIDETRV